VVAAASLCWQSSNCFVLCLFGHAVRLLVHKVADGQSTGLLKTIISVAILSPLSVK
jgi:hypothetical protein